MRGEGHSAQRAGDSFRCNTSSVYSMVNPQRREISITLIKKLCDGLEISLEAFFNDEIFEKLEQEIM